MAYDININFDSLNTGAGTGSTGDFLISTLEKLNSAIEKLSKINIPNSQGGRRNTPPPIPPTSSPSGGMADAHVQRFNQAMDSALKNLGDKIGNTLATSAMAAISVTLLRLANNETNAIMGRASAEGRFAGSYLSGTSSQAFSGYAGSLFDIERQRKINNNFALGEGAGGLTGSVAGTALSAIIGAATGVEGGPVAMLTGAAKGLGKGAAAGATVGAAGGEYLTAKYINSGIEREMQIRQAMAERQADASISQWKTGFNRFGLTMTNRTIAGSDITGGAALQVPLSADFDKKYGASPNYNAIQNNITPYLTSNLMDEKNTGNLDKVAQNFNKAGFAINDFSKLTMQSSQYQALTGKNIESFSDDVKKARVKFGDAFDISTIQTSLNLMSLGYESKQAQNIAFQSQYNPGMMSSISRFNNMGVNEFYTNQALSKMTGINIQETLRTGSFVGTDAAKKELQKETDSYNKNGSYGKTMTLLNAAGGFAPANMKSWLQKQITPPPGSESGAYLDPGQQHAKDVGDILNILKDGVTNLQTMNVQATNVVINNTGKTDTNNNLPNRPMIGTPFTHHAPSSYSGGNSPTKK